MADEDKAWDHFMESIGETEAVETGDDKDPEDDPKGGGKDPEADPDKSDEAGKGDDPDKDKDADPDKTGGADDPDKDKGDDPDADKDTPKGVAVGEFKPRLEQFVNKDGSYNLAGIEKSYIENSKESVRLNTELGESNKRNEDLLAAIAKDPAMAEKLFGKEGAKNLAKGQPPEGQAPADPTMVHIRAQLEKQSKKEYAEFIEAHPESVSDPEKAKKIGSFLKLYGQQYREENNGEFPSMKDGLEAAYRFHGWDLKIEKDEKVAAAAKKTAATRPTANKKTPAPAKKKNELEAHFASKLGVNVK